MRTFEECNDITERIQRLLLTRHPSASLGINYWVGFDVDANRMPTGDPRFLGWEVPGVQMPDIAAIFRDAMTLPAGVPESVEGWQAEIVMRSTALGTSDVWTALNAAIDAMPDGVNKITAQTVLKRGRVRRDSQLLAQLGPSLGLTGQQIDDMFRAASKIKA